MGLLSNFMSTSTNNLFDTLRKNVDAVFEEANRAFSSINFDDIEGELEKTNKRLKKTIKKLSKRVKNLTDRYVIEVPYDRNEEKLAFTHDGETFSATVTKLDLSKNSQMTFSIPSDVDTDSLSQKYFAEQKKMVFTFKKFVIDDESLDDDSTESVELVDEFPSVDETEEETITIVEEESETPTTNCDKVSQAIGLHKLGWSFRKIAKEIGVSDKTVARWIRSNS